MSRSGFDLCRDAMAVVGVTAPEQSVLLTLAVMANDDAQCWPGIAKLVELTKLSERTVQRAVQGLKEAQHLNWVEKPGRGRIYVVHPRHSGTPAQVTPATTTPRQPGTRQSDTPVTVTPTPVTVAPKQPRTTIEDNEGNARAPAPWSCPPGVQPMHWRDFRANRKRKKLTDTETAYVGQLKLIERFSCEDWPPGRLVEKAAEKGWGTIVDPSEYETQNGKRPANDHRKHEAGSPMLAGLQILRSQHLS